MDEQQPVSQPEVAQEPVQAAPTPEVPPAVPPSMPPAMPVAGASWFTGSMIAIIIGLVLAVGAGAYFMFFRGTPTSEQVLNTASPSVSPQQSVAVATLPFRCKDIFTDADFQASMKESAAGFQFKESNKEDGSSIYLHCDYYQGVVGELIVTIIRPKLADTRLAYEAIKSAVIPQGGKEVSGIGSGAVINQGVVLWSLSTNNKYIIQAMVTSPTQMQSLQEAAKLIDANLNKY